MSVGGEGDIRPDPGDQRETTVAHMMPLEQYPGNLRPIDEHVIRPFQPHPGCMSGAISAMAS